MKSSYLCHKVLHNLNRLLRKSVSNIFTFISLRFTKVSLRVRKILLHETERHQNKIRDTSVSGKYLSMRRRDTFVKRRDVKVKLSGFLTKQKDVFTLKIKMLAKNEKAESFRIKGVSLFFSFKSFNHWDKQIKSL